MPRSTSVRWTRTPSGRCDGIVVLPSSGGASDNPDGTTVRSSIYVVVRLGVFLTSSLLTGRTSTGTRVRGIIVCPVEKRLPVGRGAHGQGCLPLPRLPARARAGPPRHPRRWVYACGPNQETRGARHAKVLPARSPTFRIRFRAAGCPA